jgi:hypothetical protein
MKIKVTSTAPKVNKFDDGDDIPEGIYTDRDGDFVVWDEGNYALFSPDGCVMYGDIEWPISPAPKGTKIEISN